MAPSRLVVPPRVAASPVAFECRVIERVQLARNIVTFGQVVGVHVDERHIVDGRFDTAGVQADRPLRLSRRLRHGHRAVRDDPTVNYELNVGPLSKAVRLLG